MERKIFTKNDAIDGMFSGIKKLADVVSCTLGPDGQNVFFNRYDIPFSTKDGATVAALVKLEDKLENLGAGQIKYAAKKTADEAGDGTTTSTILAYHLIRLGLQGIQKGYNRREINDGIRIATQRILKHILDQTTEIDSKSKTELHNIAMISSNADKEIADLVSEAISKVGKDGIVTFAESTGPKTYLEFIAGMKITTSYADSGFINDPQTGSVRYSNVAIIMHDEDILKVEEFLPLMQQLRPIEPATLPDGSKNPKAGMAIDKPFVREDGFEFHPEAFIFIARSIQGEALGSMLRSFKEQRAPICAVKAPYGEYFLENMEDLATCVGGQVVSANHGFTMKEAKASAVVGFAEEVTITDKGFWIIGGAPREEDLKKRLDYLHEEMERKEHKNDKKLLEHRIARLSGGVAQIYVGGKNPQDAKERGFRIDDSIAATKSALIEGIVPGGCVSLIKAYVKGSSEKGMTESQKYGHNLTYLAILEPFKQLLINSGIEDGSKQDDILGKISDSKEKAYGYNARNKTFCDMMEEGVIDPTKVVRSALDNASTVAQAFLLTGAALVDEREAEISADGDHDQNQHRG